MLPLGYCPLAPLSVGVVTEQNSEWCLLEIVKKQRNVFVLTCRNSNNPRALLSDSQGCRRWRLQCQEADPVLKAQFLTFLPGKCKEVTLVVGGRVSHPRRALQPLTMSQLLLAFSVLPCTLPQLHQSGCPWPGRVFSLVIWDSHVQSPSPPALSLEVCCP